ncbi:hypothetical protein SNEBB_007593 [Seison nebaliae]|nr:hypothetical protein SNEBB_007593 [Seison nebaliae]
MFHLLRQQIRFQSSVTNQIKKTINENKIVLFMKGTPESPQCGFSRGALQILQMNDVKEFSAINVLETEELRSEIKKFSNWPTIPQLYVDGEFVGGFDIALEMHKNGELKELLAKTLSKPEKE